jgi:dTDP-4-amino-4,6-dideoxygalactose transaminase
MIPLFKVFMANDAAQRVGETLASGYIGEGPRVSEFEEAFGRLVGGAPLALNSGTSALELALYLCGVGLGTDVVTTPMTCTATNGAILRLGGTPVWADIDPLTGLIDPVDVRQKITGRTKAIMAVDWGGRSCDYDVLRDTAGGIPVIQDAAHTLLVDQKNRGDYVCWSFQAIKHLTTGDGGALLVPERQRDRARLMRWYGLDRTSSADFRCAQNIVEAGWKIHMNDVAASIGLANLPHVGWIVGKHRANAAWYEKALMGIAQHNVYAPEPDSASSWWLYTLLVPDRDEFIKRLAEQGVAASPVHRRNDEHEAFYFPNGKLPGVDYFASREVAIPVGWWLSDQDREKVASAVWSSVAVPA